MKAITFLCLLSSATLFAQQKELVKWSFRAKCTVPKDSLWVIVIKANIESGWHIYSQIQGKSHICQPTVIKFFPSPLFIPLAERITETGYMTRMARRIAYEMVVNNQYSDSVEFIAALKVKQPHVKTSVTLSITWQVCTEDMCMPAMTKLFTIPLD